MILPVLAVVTGVYLETALPSWLSLAGRRPDLALSLCVAFSALHGPYRGALLGCLAGILIDAMLGRFIGSNALSFACACYVVGWLARDYLRVSPLLGFSCGMVGSVIKYSLQVVALRTGGLAVPFSTAVCTVAAAALWGSLLVPIWLRALEWLSEGKGASRL